MAIDNTDTTTNFYKLTIIDFDEEFVKNLAILFEAHYKKEFIDNKPIFILESENKIFPVHTISYTGNYLVSLKDNKTIYSVSVTAFVNRYLNQWFQHNNTFKNVPSVFSQADKEELIESINKKPTTEAIYDTIFFLGFSLKTVETINIYYDGLISSMTENGNIKYFIKDASVYFPYYRIDLTKSKNGVILAKVYFGKSYETISITNLSKKLKEPFGSEFDEEFSYILDSIVKDSSPIAQKSTFDILTTPVNRNLPATIPSKPKEPYVPMVLPKYNDFRDEVLNIFVDLTQYVIPYKMENVVIEKIKKIIPEIQMDEFGNLFLNVGESQTLFTSHLDTVGGAYTKIFHVFKDDGFIRTDGSTILGGDNKAGVTIMLWMIKNKVPGLYYFFLGEECGCHGSRWLLKENTELLKKYKRAIAFDRREQGSVITYQRSERCCSDKFALDVSEAFKKHAMTYVIDPNGVFTDTAIFTDVIPECTNLSAGVYDEHTKSERLHIEYFSRVCEAVIKIDWEALGTYRDPNTKERKSYGGNNITNGYSGNRYNTYDDDDIEFDNYFNKSNKKKSKDIPTDKELLVLWNSGKTGTYRKNILTSGERLEALEIWKESYLEYENCDRFLTSKGFYSKSDFVISKPMEYKYHQGNPTVMLTIIPENGTYINSTLIFNHSDMVKEIDNILKKKREKKEHDNGIFPDEFRAQELRTGSFILDTKEGPLETKEFIENNGGNMDSFILFTKLEQVNKNNVYYWPAWYKILLTVLDFDNIGNYRIDHLSKLVADKWESLSEETGLKKMILSYVMRDKKINSDFSQKWNKILVDLAKDPEVDRIVDDYLAGLVNKKDKKNFITFEIQFPTKENVGDKKTLYPVDTSEYTDNPIDTINKLKISIPVKEVLDVKKIVNNITEMNYDQYEVFDYITKHILKYDVLQQRRYPCIDEIKNTFAYISLNKNKYHDWPNKVKSQIINDLKAFLLNKKK